MATMVITITEDADPNGYIEVAHDIQGFDADSATRDADLPPAVMAGARMLQTLEEV